MTTILAPYTSIADIDGSPLDAGFVFIGEQGKNPESSPVSVFWDAEFTIPAAQPIRTRNGYPARNGSPAKIYLREPMHSISVKNRNGSTIFVDVNGAGLVSTLLVRPSGATVEQTFNNIDASLAEKQQQINEKAPTEYVNEQLALKANMQDVYNKSQTYTQMEVNNLVDPKADQTYVDEAIGAISTDANKQYATLAAANADIANIVVGRNVFISEEVNGGYWYKATAEATSLTKSPFDPVEKSKEYTDDQIALIPIEQINLADYSLVLKDTNGLLAVGILLDKNGKPSIYMLNSIFEGLVDRISSKVVQEIGDVGVELKQALDGSCFLVDKNGKMSWFGVGKDGEIPAYTQKCILDLIGGSDFSLVPSSVKSTYQEAEIKAVSGPNINCIGDSMTAGAGGGGTSYPSVLNTLLIAHGSSAQVYNSGVGGESSVTITARVGGYPITVRVDDGVIPATTTPVNVTFEQVNGVSIAPLVQGSGGGFGGVFAGVEGNFSLSSGQYRFTRATAGNEVVVNRPTPYVNNYAKARRGDISIIWIGQNGPSTERAIQDAKAIIRNLNALNKRWIVISKPTATPADDAAFFAEFGDRFIAAKKYMVEFGLADAGITPTEQDLTDMSNYVIPLPLCASSSDRLHWSAAGYTVLANLIFKKLQFLGWI